MLQIACWKLCETGPSASSQAGKYDESLKHLEALQELNKDDYKIAMNKAVVEFYKSGQTTTGTLKQTLMAVKNQVTAGHHFVFVPVEIVLVFKVTDDEEEPTCLCFRFTHQRRMWKVWMMWKTACSIITRPSSTIICGSTLKPFP